MKARNLIALTDVCFPLCIQCVSLFSVQFLRKEIFENCLKLKRFGFSNGISDLSDPN